MADQHIGSNTPTVMRRSRDDRIGIAGGDFGFVLVLGCLLMLLVVSIDPDPSDWSLVLVGVAVTATEVAVVLRAMRSEVRLMGDNLVISRALPTKVVAVSAVRSVWE